MQVQANLAESFATNYNNIFQVDYLIFPISENKTYKSFY